MLNRQRPVDHKVQEIRGNQVQRSKWKVVDRSICAVGNYVLCCRQVADFPEEVWTSTIAALPWIATGGPMPLRPTDP